MTTEFAFEGIKIGQLLGDVNGPREFVLTPEQYRGLIENAPNDKYRSIFEILAHTGMRKGELNGITWGDVDLEKGVVTLSAEITKTSQTPLQARAIYRADLAWEMETVGVPLRIAAGVGVWIPGLHPRGRGSRCQLDTLDDSPNS